MGTIIEATYSVEDNKLRLYPDGRLDAETYQRVKQSGFKWAPKQELFVAPAWSPALEDFCLSFVDEITPEGTTLVERAAAKAERLENLSEKRAKESGAFYSAAQNIAARFEGGQPILVGHHSERRARKDKDRMERAMDRSVKAEKASGWWLYRATGVERHANRKADAGVRARRIDRLLKSLRDHQRALNHAHLALELWERIADKAEEERYPEMVKQWAGMQIRTGAAAPYGIWGELDREELTPEKAVEKIMAHHAAQLNSPSRYRWIEHLLNRLAYEREELGPVTQFTGKLTPAILQTFARSQGADQPKATATGAGFTLETAAPLPLHIGEGKSLTLDAEQWRELMQECGYEVPAPKPKKPPLLNIRAKAIKAARYGDVTVYPVIEMTKAEYAKVYNDYKGTRLATCETFRFRTVMKNFSLAAVFVTDSKVHPVPDSEAVTLDDQEGAA